MRGEPGVERVARAKLRQLPGIARVGEELDAVASENRLFRRQLPALLKSVGQLARLQLARLDIGLVERVDPDWAAGARGADLPSAELRAEVRPAAPRDDD